ncbi:thioredoxin-like protein [Scheffersomyces coipomensis]|uniref:thioredoxin-like protein n=1 Tax=Scheffersomyces coipomensis TaxID=1788519 RepID=UPI00315C6C31
MPELRRSARVAAKPAVPPPAFEEEPPKKKNKQTSINTNGGNGGSKVKELEVDDKIPDITLFDEDNNEVNLVEAANKAKYIVIFAYPKASTPGCTRQACGFQRNYEFLKSNNVTVFGLSADLPKSQKNFVVKQKLEYSLLSDPSKELIGILGAKKYPTGIKRSHWIFVDGVLKVKRIQISPEASIDGAKAEIEKFIKQGGDEPKEEEDEDDEDEEEIKKVEDLKVEDEKVEEPVIDEPIVEEPKAEEPNAEEPKVEEPKVEEPKVEEPTNGTTD